MKITCPVAGYPIDTITWERENVKLPTNMWQRVYNGTLHIENVQRAADQGTYTCVARNRHNETSERSVVVKVLGELILNYRLKSYRICVHYKKNLNQFYPKNEAKHCKEKSIKLRHFFLLSFIAHNITAFAHNKLHLHLCYYFYWISRKNCTKSQ